MAPASNPPAAPAARNRVGARVAQRPEHGHERRRRQEGDVERTAPPTLALHQPNPGLCRRQPQDVPPPRPRPAAPAPPGQPMPSRSGARDAPAAPRSMSLPPPCTGVKPTLAANAELQQHRTQVRTHAESQRRQRSGTRPPGKQRTTEAPLWQAPRPPARPVRPARPRDRRSSCRTSVFSMPVPSGHDGRQP